MQSLPRSSIRALWAVLVTLAVAVAAVALLSRAQPARGADVGQLQQQISSGQNRISGLSGALGAASAKISQLQSSIGPLESKLTRLQADLDARRAELLKLQDQLSRAKSRLAQLEAFQAHAETILAQHLVNAYESDRPDIVTVVLQAKGMTDLLERVAFAQRIQKQDVQIVSQVRAARRATAEQATRLGGLEARQQKLTAQVLQQRNDLARTRLSLVQQKLAIEQARSATAAQLARARGEVADLQKQLSKIQLAQAAAANPSHGSIQVSSGGGFTFPMPKGAASPPGTWTLDQGVDIAAPGNTPLLAVGSGTIVLHGIGGFGPSAPVLHLDSGPYVYYGHAGPGNMVPIGTHVSAGQVISEVGAGIVGISTGPHLEIGFSDGSGTPVGSGSASQMMSLLQGSY
jgi:murein DD-endopeptidase MepM/ murein hydrolase activator NlpD